MGWDGMKMGWEGWYSGRKKEQGRWMDGLDGWVGERMSDLI
jgi:hypothetical protein